MAREKCYTRKLVEGFDLNFPDDAHRFIEVFFEATGEGSTVGEMFKALADAFPDKKDRILSIPVFKTIDGEVHIHLISKEDWDKKICVRYG